MDASSQAKKEFDEDPGFAEFAAKFDRDCEQDEDLKMFNVDVKAPAEPGTRLGITTMDSAE